MCVGAHGPGDLGKGDGTDEDDASQDPENRRRLQCDPAGDTVGAPPCGGGPFCSTTSTTITVTSNSRNYDLRIRSTPATYPNGKAKDASSAEMFNAFGFATAAGGPFLPITAVYQNIFSNQPKGSNINHTVYYRQCVDWGDSAGNFTIGVDYLLAEL
ncbi:MAG: hypothetical protein AUI83_09070 [Armatimonadetes bacterium 13_1_40CM_3_65_7]|nr:MAG: hypothetical protein AUI83_09070 [Armatimonadetes bacterium 13_1_40CM_3_65_7]